MAFLVFIFPEGVQVPQDAISEIIIMAVFLFAFFVGFFTTRQNDRYTSIAEYIAERDGAFSFLYRVSFLVPRIQNEVREIIRNHYKKILDNNDWAYHEFHTSTTITELTKSFGSLADKEIEGQAKVLASYVMIWDTTLQLQKLRKKIILLCHEKLILSQWLLVFILAAITVFSLNLLHAESFMVDLFKLIFTASVFLIIILLRQLDNLSIFGSGFSKNIANDVLRILDEVDEKESLIR